jgi:hypothetical protein
VSEAPVQATPAAQAARNGARSSLREALAGEGRIWGLSRRGTLVLALVPIGIALIGIVTGGLGKDVYRWIVGEDKIGETVQVLAYFGALVLAVVLARRLWNADRRGLAAVFGLFAAALVFQTGEELSWGQRVFGWGTPESFAEGNKQGETNLHNVYGVGASFKWIQAVVAAYAGIVPLVLLRWKLPERHRATAAFLVAPVSLVLYFLPLFVWRIYRNAAPTPDTGAFFVTEYNEVMEISFALGVLLFLVYQLRRSRQPGWPDLPDPR